MSNPLIAPELHTLAQEFLWNAEHAFPDSSPLYAKLARRITGDAELLALAAHRQPRQPAVNLLFASVHYLLLTRVDDPLALFYADLVRKPDLADDPFPVFRAFCLEHTDAISELIATRRVQTNEVGRCALFLPVFTLIAARVNQEPFAVIEVGSSAGLNLNWDRYGYEYGEGIFVGDAQSRVQLQCDLRGAVVPPFSGNFPAVASRVGVDIQPNDVNDADAMLWLRALVWPEQIERAIRLERAIALAQKHPPSILAGDALERVPQLIREIPLTTPLVLFHSFVLNQIPPEARARYQTLLVAESAGRVLFDVAIEPRAFPAPLVLTTLHDGESKSETLARCEQHGRWLEWLPESEANDSSL